MLPIYLCFAKIEAQKGRSQGKEPLYMFLLRKTNDTCRGFPTDHVATPQISWIKYSPMEAQLATSKTC